MGEEGIYGDPTARMPAAYHCDGRHHVAIEVGWALNQRDCVCLSALCL